MSAIEGRARVYGDNIDTDAMAPSAYMIGSIEGVAAHCLESIDPDFASSVETGDVFVAGDNLGIGSSREQAPQALLTLGIRAVIARSFARIFYRNSLNLGLPALVCPEAGRIQNGDTVRVDAEAGTVTIAATGETLKCEPLPSHLLTMIADGGLMPHLEKKFKTKP